MTASRLAPHLQRLLNLVQDDREPTRRSHYPEVAALQPSERAQLVEALLDRVHRHPQSVALTAVIELAEHNTDIVDTVCESLRRIPPASVPGSAGSAAVRRLPIERQAVVALWEHWQASDNSSLAVVVKSGRAARAKSGR